MRAAVVSEFGPFDAIRVQELDTPSAGDGEVVVRTSVAGVNFADAGMVTGAARRKEPPFVPGVEASGVVESVGAGVTELSVGQRVVYWNPMPAAFAEFAVVPGWRCVAIPEGVSDEAAVTLMVQGTTAHYLAMDSAPLEAGMSCLVYAAAGGVGHLLVQVANQLGARVIAVVGRRLADADVDVFEALLAHPELADAGHALRRVQEAGAHTMAPELEGLAADLGVNGLSAWGRLYDTVSGRLEFELAVPGQPAERRPVAATRSLTPKCLATACVGALLKFAR